MQHSQAQTRFEISTNNRLSVRDITEQVCDAIPDEATGIATVFIEHTTAAVTVNEAENRLQNDFETALDELIDNTGWQHDELDGNADSHIRAMLIGASATIPVTDGRLTTGTWQSVLLIECDGPRTRTVSVTVTPTVSNRN
ncbi:secondary thiamine-phosphate synthase enzyme YjbQ [Haloquadratum walsbyi]|jgi:secondary thiamine-phosphate synthase enzyme|uniref:Secondary thiamine-phosphate synthase enzyme n=1 Tax=Haloquadratum walsbyi J07HQW2 TaxID=1238425 RepID=U1NGG0_9EURY|nr:secondary thiamine-phosphate synthase enzyme YjbQ [Haloquadratum walsbyi]ERG96215.1 MAG: secondary thiamine-phosphate synthase enzyme [Haloquadratum walsbyi J07HQW2]